MSQEQPQVAASDGATPAPATPALLVRIRTVVCVPLDRIDELARRLINLDIAVY